jgi:hypothetical protein
MQVLGQSPLMSSLLLSSWYCSVIGCLVACSTKILQKDRPTGELNVRKQKRHYFVIYYNF